LPSVAAPRARRSFARLNKSLDVPNLIDIQRRSFDWLVDAEAGGLRETIDDISPIEDYTGHLAVQFGDFHFDEPSASIDECREKDLTYSRPLTVTVAFINHETGEIREQSVFMGDFPWMTDRGTFIINGTERVVVTQLVRSPGAYLMEPKDREKQVFTANLMPARGSWLELEIDKKGRVFVRIDRKRKLPVTVLLRAMTYNPETDGNVEEGIEDIERLDQELLVRDESHRAQQDGDRQLALAVDPDEDLALLVDLHLQPGAARGHQVGGEDLLLAVLGLHHVRARGAHELGDDDALGAVDDERAPLRHPREVAHEDRLLADLAGLPVDEGHRDGERARVGEVLLAAFVDRRGGLVEVELAELDGEVPRVVLDRGDVVDRLAQAAGLGIDEPVERPALDVDQVGDIEGLVQARE
jgi:hypothetical protein